MGCACNKRNRALTAGAAVNGKLMPSTYRVIVNGRQVYETSKESAASEVAARFADAEILEPGKTL